MRFKSFFFWLWFPVFASLAACQDDPAQSTAADAKQTALQHAEKHLDIKYVCPMHSQIMRDAPASCPICGMDLIKQQIDLTSQAYPQVTLGADIVQKLGVRTSTVQRGKLWKYTKTVGYVKYNEHRLSTVQTRTFGWVENLGVRTEGQQVKKGQLLLELYSPEFLKVQKDFIAAQKKDKSGPLTKYAQRQESVEARDYLRYLAVSESLTNEIARNGKPRHRIPIYAPQHGLIVRHNVHDHMFVEPDYPMLTIVDLSSVWVEADVYEHQLDWVKPGQKAEIEVQALPGRRFSGYVKYVYPELDPRTRTLKVRLLIPNPDAVLKPNMFAQVVIYGGPKRGVLKIPREALIVTGERENVVLDRGEGRYQPVDVVTGMHSRGEVEILSGINEGDRIVVSGQFLIDSESNLQASFRRLDSVGGNVVGSAGNRD